MGWLGLGAILVLPVAEILVWMRAAEAMGGLMVLALTVLAVLAGTALLRQVGLATVMEVRARIARGETPGPALFDGLCLACAGILLIVPGFISDGLGLLLLAPPVRRLLLRLGKARWPAATPPSGGPTVIDADFQVITPEAEPGAGEHKRLEP